MTIDTLVRGKLSYFNYIRRDEILKVICFAYKSVANKSIPIYGVKVENLKEYTTSKGDRKKGIRRVPNDTLRIDHLLD